MLPHLEFLKKTSEEYIRLSEEYKNLFDQIIQFQGELKSIDDDRKRAKETNNSELLEECRRKLRFYCKLNTKAVNTWVRRSEARGRVISDEENYEMMRWAYYEIRVDKDDYSSFFDLDEEFKKDWEETAASLRPRKNK